MSSQIILNDTQKQIFEKISKNETNEFKRLIAHIKTTVNFVDENGMSPLQHACCKGNIEAVQTLLDQGADVNFNQHGANYTPLHFAALSGNKDICIRLLDAGVNQSALNSVMRTASQMAAFVGNHACVETINNYVPKSQLEVFTKTQGKQVEPYLPPQLLDYFHKFVIEVNLHPVRIALNLERNGNLVKHLPKLKKVLELLMENEMHKKCDINELMAFKYHYLRWILSEILRCEEQCQLRKESSNESDGKHDFIELFVKRVLKENKLGQLEYIEFTVRECVREFPFRECAIFRQIVSQLANKESPPALFVIRNAINGQRGFIDEVSFCSTCGEEKPDKKCSKCRAVRYCDRECQRLHWFIHKKSCARPISAAGSSNQPLAMSENKTQMDENEICQTLRNMADEVSFCSTCGEEKQDKKCSKCRAVRYCDRECQRLHWFIHKKSCARPTSAAGSSNQSLSISENKKQMDENEICQTLRNMADEVSFCSTCGEEKQDKKCSKCRAVRYCDRECQRLHWFIHKKSCARPTSAAGSSNQSLSISENKKQMDENEICQTLRNMADEVSFCSTCGEEKQDKKCSKCRAVRYCDKECQRLHWFIHKKSCARPTSAAGSSNQSLSMSENKKQMDENEICQILRNMADEVSFCSTCGEEKQDKKCSKCRAVRYCDKECQRLHWFIHKKSCARPTSAAGSSNQSLSMSENKKQMDENEICQILRNMAVS